MRLGISITLFLVLLSTLSLHRAKAQTDSLYIEATSYISGVYYRTLHHAFIDTGQVIDRQFFQEEFYEFYAVPKALIIPGLRDSTLVKWANEGNPQVTTNNWYNTYQYDSLGRLSSFSYSGFQLSSSFPFTYRSEYDEHNRLAVLKTVGLHQKVEKEVRVTRNEVGDIAKLIVYGYGRIEKIYQLQR